MNTNIINRNFDTVLYNRLSDKPREFFYSSADAIELDLGYILLKILDTVPLMCKQKANIFIGNELIELDFEKYLENVAKVFIDTEKDILIFDDLLKELYSSGFARVTYGEIYIDAIRGIKNYIELCMDYKEFYTYANFVALASLACGGFTPPRVEVSVVKNDMNKSTLKKLFLSSNKSSYLNEHACQSLPDICLASLYELINSGYLIKSCEQCGKWFVEYSKNEKYCAERCMLEARRQKEKKRVSGGIAQLLKNRRQYYDNNAMVNEKAAFNKTVIQWREKIKTGTATEADLEKWILSTYKRSRS